jgi:hypothetical protein
VNYAIAQRNADAKIRKDGGVFRLEWDTDQTVDVVTDQPGKADPTGTNVSFVAFPMSFRGRSADSLQDGTEILTRVRRFLMGALRLSIEPKPGMRIVGWEKKTWTIESCAPLCPDGKTVVLWNGFLKQ